MAGRLAATGILLVGGASERFGSPKALARFRGETLAERAWRVLGEAFDEVLAVGKEGELELPFPVLDDGSEERAPVFGLLAGLRRRLARRRARAPGRLPARDAGAAAAARRMPAPSRRPARCRARTRRPTLPELEARVARGELSLRGVNPRVLDADVRLLANVNTRMDLIETAIADWGRSRDDVRAVLVVGSRARTEAPADRWSDLDAVLFVDEPERLAEDASWVSEFGSPVLTFLEPTAIGERVERRVLYEGGEDVDFPLVEASTWRELSSEARGVLSRGYRLLHDELGLEAELAKLTAPAAAPPPTQADFDQLAADFWYHALWTARKLRRGEVFTALDCLDGYLKARLVTLLEWHARALDPEVDTWHGGRFLERWADPGALAALENAYAHYDLRDVARALWATIDLWQGLEEEVARRLGLEVMLDHADLRRRIDEVVPMTAGGHRIAP